MLLWRLKHLCWAPSADQSHVFKREKLKGEEGPGYFGASPERQAAHPSPTTTSLPMWDRISPPYSAQTNTAFAIFIQYSPLGAQIRPAVTADSLSATVHADKPHADTQMPGLDLPARLLWKFCCEIRGTHARTQVQSPNPGTWDCSVRAQPGCGR